MYSRYTERNTQQRRAGEAEVPPLLKGRLGLRVCEESSCPSLVLVSLDKDRENDRSTSLR